MIPVLRRTRAIDDMMFRVGSHARKPHSSVRSKPLGQKVSAVPSTRTRLRRRRNIAEEHMARSVTMELGTTKSSHLMQSISIKCCSAMLFSLFTFLCNAVKICLLSANASPQFLFRVRSSWFPKPVWTSVLASEPGLVIEKYSSSSRRTMMACLHNKGFCEESVDGSDGEEGMLCWAWKSPGEVGVP